MEFRNTRKGDVEKSTPLAMPQLTDVKYMSAYRRQQKGYVLLKKMLFDKDGKIYRATGEEIEAALKGTDEDDDLWGLTGPEYVFAVERMFQKRR